MHLHTVENIIEELAARVSVLEMKLRNLEPLPINIRQLDPRCIDPAHSPNYQPQGVSRNGS